MKKNIISGLIGLTLLLPGVASATVNELEELRAQINSLLAMVAQLQAQLTSQTGTSEGAFCFTFNTDLKIGDRGSEVSRLHAALEREGFSIPDSERPQKDGESVFGAIFGEMTASKVSAFQEKYRSEILTPAGLSNGTGYLGARTRAKLNALYGCDKPVVSQNPIACTMEAMLCSDGKTYVGRTGPSCQFAACPTTNSASNLYISLDGSSSSSQVVNPGSSNVNVGNFKIFSQNGDATIQNIRFGVNSYPFCPGKSYSLFDGNTLLSSVSSTDSGCNFFFNNLNYTIPSNTTKILSVKMDFLPGTMPEKFAVQMKEIGTKNVSKVSGLPVTANPVTIVDSNYSTNVITGTTGLCVGLSKNWGETYVDVEGGSITKNGIGYVVDGAIGVSAGANQTMNFYAYLPDGHSKGQVSVTYPNSTEDSYIKARGILIASITSGSNPSNPNSSYGGVIKNIDSKIAKCPSYTRTAQAPSISYIEPTSATVGATIYVYGSNFNNATFVGIDGVNGVSAQPSSINLISPTKLSFVVPSLSIGTHTVAVAEKAGPWDLSSPVSLTVIAPPVTVTKPDLIVGAVACEPLNINVNENKIFCQVTVWNNSSTDVTQPFDVNIQGSAVTINGLKAQERKTVKNPSGFGFSVAGSYTLNFPIDIWNSVNESNESNNSHSITITVGSAPTQAPTGTLSFYRNSLNFDYIKGDYLPPLQLLTFSNNSGVNIDYKLSVPNKPSWLNTSYATDVLTLTPGVTTSVLASVSPENLSPGSYSTNLVISGNFTGSPISIPINLTVR